MVRCAYDHESIRKRVVVPRSRKELSFIRLRFTFLPYLIIVLTILTLIVTYSVDVAYHHQDRPFPMISETGEQQPERFVFTFSFGIVGAVLFAITATMFADEMHWQQYELIICSWGEYQPSTFYAWLPLITWIIGLLMSIGIVFVGLVPDNTVEWLHFTGATIAFVCTALWTLATGICIRNLDLTRARLAKCDSCIRYEFSPCNVFVRRITYGIVSVIGLILLLVFRVADENDGLANDYFLAVFEFLIVLPLLAFLWTLRNFIKKYAVVRGADEELHFTPHWHG